MFDIGFGELIVIGAVALVVLGPERLPTVARTIGALVGRAQRFVASVKADLDQELHQTELAKIEAELRAEGQALHNTIHQDVIAPMQQARSELTQHAQAAQSALTEQVQSIQQSLAEVQPAISEPSTAPATPPAAAAARASSAYAETVVVPPSDDGQLDLFAPPPAPPASGNDRR